MLQAVSNHFCLCSKGAIMVMMIYYYYYYY